MAIDPNAIGQGIATGRSIPNKNTGLSEMIKVITNDLKTAKAERIKNSQTDRENNINILKSYLAADFKPNTPEAMNRALQGDFSGFQKTNPMADAVSMLGNMQSGGSGGMRPKGMSIGASGPTFSFEAGIPTAEVGKANLASQAITDLDDAKKLLFPKGEKGGLSKYAAIASNVPGNKLPILGALIPQKLPFSGIGQDVYRKLYNAIAAKQLIQTGVAARPEETQRLVDQYLASWTSNPESTIKGFNELQNFYKGYLNTLKTGELPQSMNQSKGQGQIMIDANGNKAMVYQDGSYEEIK